MNYPKSHRLLLWVGLQGLGAIIDSLRWKNLTWKNAKTVPGLMALTAITLPLGIMVYLPFLPYENYIYYKHKEHKRLEAIRTAEKLELARQQEDEYKKKVAEIGVECTKCHVKYLFEELFQTNDGSMECSNC
jgi:hypothetical protein